MFNESNPFANINNNNGGFHSSDHQLVSSHNKDLFSLISKENDEIFTNVSIPI